jgi:hypothetical protein
LIAHALHSATVTQDDTYLDDLVGGAGEDCGQLLQAGQQVQDVRGVREGQVLNAEKSKYYDRVQTFAAVEKSDGTGARHYNFASFDVVPTTTTTRIAGTTDST